MEFKNLRAMNLEFPTRENAGDRSYFESRLAAAFAMRRGNGVVIGREQFLQELKPGGDRKCVALDSVSVLGERRAVVTCVVHAAGKSYQNLRLLIQDEAAPEGWLLLAWANEPA